jgi:acyl-CoA thioester hydrolase
MKADQQIDLGSPSRAPSAFCRRFKVRHYECAAQGHVNNAVYLQYMQQTAVEASAAAGFGLEWYEAQGTVWVIRKMTIEYLRPAFADDELEVTTWISAFHRVRAYREYEVRLVRRGEVTSPLLGSEALSRPEDDLIACAQADWVYVNRQTSRPARIPAEALALFAPNGQSALPPHRPDPPLADRVAREFHSQRRVQCYELDPMVHVNNAIYLNWLQQAVFEACAEVGWTWPRLLDSGVVIVQRRHEIEYFRPALRDDEIEIVSQVVGWRRVTGTWQQDVYCVRRDGQSLDPPLHLARDYNQGAFLALDGRLTRLPPKMIDALAPVAGSCG